MVSLPPVARPLATSRKQPHRHSCASYLAGRPAPVDAIERALLRLDWLGRRLAGRR